MIENIELIRIINDNDRAFVQIIMYIIDITSVYILWKAVSSYINVRLTIILELV